MSLWSLSNPPVWVPNALADQSGWRDPSTQELIVAIGSLVTKSDGADIESISFALDAYERNDLLVFNVKYNEKVNVSAGAYLNLSWSGISGNFNIYAAAQTGVSIVVFNKQSDHSTAIHVPNEAGTLSIVAEAINGTIVDNLGSHLTSGHTITSGLASGAGSIIVS